MKRRTGTKLKTKKERNVEPNLPLGVEIGNRTAANMEQNETARQPQKKGVNQKYLKIGSLSITTTAIVIAVVVVVNLLLGELPETYTKYDISSLGLYSIGEETETVVGAVDTDVNIYIIAERGSEDPTIKELLGRYEALNSHIRVSTVDPGTNPAFIQRYTEESVSANSLIFESDKRSYVVDYYDIYTTEYSEEELYYYMYYGQKPTGTTYFNGELAITSAIDYVTRDDIPTMYTLSGHGESELNATYQSYITSDNIADGGELRLLGMDEIPADCTSILINSPTSDITADESEMLMTYLDQGGNIILITSYTAYSETNMPNLAKLTAKMGLESVDGIVMETNRSNYTGYPYSLLPVKGNTSTEPLSLLSTPDKYVLMHASHGIISNGTTAGTVIPMLSTTSGAYVKADPSNLTTYEKEDGDVSGVMYVACAVTGEADGTRSDTCKFVWYASPSIADESVDTYYTSGGNSDMFMASLNWMSENKTSLSILAKQLQVESLTFTEAQSSMWTTVVTIVIPLAVLALGFVVWFRRRKK